jgi:hypothetical protein
MNIDDVQPDWLEDGLGISGQQSEPDLSDATQWDTDARSSDNQQQDFTSATAGLEVTDGTTDLTGVTKISFDGAYFTVTDYGGGEAHVTLKTTTC